MPGISELHVEGYRSLRDVTVDGMGRINLLIGGNNAGKTSILEAIGLIARPLDPTQWIQTVTSREFSGSVLDGLWGMFPASKVIDLSGTDTKSNPMVIRALCGKSSRTMSVRATVFAEQWTDVEQASRAESQTDAFVQIEGNAQVDDKFVDCSMDFHAKPKRIYVDKEFPSLRVFTITTATHRSTEQLIRYLSRAINSGVKKQLVQLLKLFDSAVKDVMISRAIDRDAIRVDHEERGIVDLSTFGDGMRRAFAMSSALLMASDGILLIDEIESGLHAQALDSVLPWLSSAAKMADVQIVATTHSLEAIDAVISAFANDTEGVTTYFLRKTKIGHFCARHDLAALRNLRAEGLDIR
jgi:ABC-type branched-subunit amino acid transport system ATPase component